MAVARRAGPNGQIRPQAGLLSSWSTLCLPLCLLADPDLDPRRRRHDERTDNFNLHTLSLGLLWAADGGTAGDGGARSGSCARNGLIDGLGNGLAGGLEDFFLFFID
jgi:hypothetical protein